MENKLKLETTSFSLHIMAMVFMLCDHLWGTIVPGADWLTCIGRLTFPIYAFMIVEGYFHTKNIKKYVKKFTPPNKPIAEIRAEIEQRKKIENKQGDGMPSHDYHCAKRLKGLLEMLQCCFEKWVEEQPRTIVGPQYLNIETEDSFFINLLGCIRAKESRNRITNFWKIHF